jgi:hypothetical protein
MKSDIILNDDKVEITGLPVAVKGSFIVETLGGEQLLRLNSAYMAVGNPEGDHFQIQVESKDGRTKISPTYVSSDLLVGRKIRSPKINAQEIEIGPTATDSPKISKIILNNKQGNAVITLDGEKEDILLSSIGGNGSLTDKIKELERKIDELKRLHQMG